MLWVVVVIGVVGSLVLQNVVMYWQYRQERQMQHINLALGSQNIVLNSILNGLSRLRGGNVYREPIRWEELGVVE